MQSTQRDVRETALFREAEAIYCSVRRPGAGELSDAAEFDVSPDGHHAVFSGTIAESLEGLLPTRICRIDLGTGEVRVISSGPNTDRLPRYSPDARRIAFLSDRRAAGNFQLYLLDPLIGEAQSTPRLAGWVEYLQWSPDGRRILLGAAGHGADLAGAQGGTASRPASDSALSWMPVVDTGSEGYRWRRAWIYELENDVLRQVSPDGSNVWEAAWCGNDRLAAVVSPGPLETLWYNARLNVIERETGVAHEVYVPKAQMGLPAASPAGEHLAFVEAICSDRLLVAGVLQILETTSGRLYRIDTAGVDITYLEWRSDRILLLAGHRGAETVIGTYDLLSRKFSETWASREITTGGRYVTVAGLNDKGDCVLVGENFLRAPEISLIRSSNYKVLRSFDLGYSAYTEAIQSVEVVNWTAPDGLGIEGWLLRPKYHDRPHPLVLHVHGGPVWQWRPTWLGRAGATVLMQLKRGYAVFLPNPRGSAGYGQEFAGRVLGDIGGADTKDLLSGLDYLVAQGIADPSRLGVIGTSYGGFMASWLITQDTRFAAAVSLAPHTNQVTEHLLSNIPAYPALFLADSYRNPGGAYYQRSPIMHAYKTSTPTLNVCGALDRSTPPEEAAQFHNALLQSGSRSVLVTYPEEGHGIRRFPAMIDYASRVVGWFIEHMPADETPAA